MVSAPAQRNRRGPPAGRALPPWPALGTPRRGYFRRWPPRGPRRHDAETGTRDRKSTRLNSSHQIISYAVFCLKKKKKNKTNAIVKLIAATARRRPETETKQLYI